MLKSFRETSTESDIVVSLHIDDPYILEYYKIECCKALNLNNNDPTTAINYVFELYPDYEWYHLTNDDVEYLTPGWDKKILDGVDKPAILYGPEGYHNKEMCVFPVIHGDIARAVGWLQYPKIRFWYGDTIWMKIGEELGLLRYIPEFRVGHHNPLNDPSIKKDETHKRAALEDNRKKDALNYVIWTTKYRKETLKKIRDKLGLQQVEV